MCQRDSEIASQGVLFQVFVSGEGGRERERRREREGGRENGEVNNDDTAGDNRARERGAYLGLKGMDALRTMYIVMPSAQTSVLSENT